MTQPFPEELTQKRDVPPSQPATWFTRPEVDNKPIKEQPMRFVGGILNDPEDQIPTPEDILAMAGPPPPVDLRQRTFDPQIHDPEGTRRRRIAQPPPIRQTAGSNSPSTSMTDSGGGLPPNFREAVDSAVRTDSRQEQKEAEVPAERYFGIALPTLRDPRVHRVVIGESLAQVGVNFNRIDHQSQTRIMETMHNVVENMIGNGQFVLAARRLGAMSGGVWGVDVQGFGILMALSGFAVTAVLLDLE